MLQLLWGKMWCQAEWLNGLTSEDFNTGKQSTEFVTEIFLWSVFSSCSDIVYLIFLL